MESKELAALRKQILKAGKVRMASVTVSQKLYSNGMSSPIESKNQQIVEIGIDDLMALVTAEVERAMPTWWITTAPIATTHKKVLGPFHTREIALDVRKYLEKAMSPTTYWVDQEKLQPQKDKS